MTLRFPQAHLPRADAAEKGSTSGIPCVICHGATTDQGHFSGSSVRVTPPPEPVSRNRLMSCKLRLGILASSFFYSLSLQLLCRCRVAGRSLRHRRARPAPRPLTEGMEVPGFIGKFFDTHPLRPVSNDLSNNTFPRFYTRRGQGDIPALIIGPRRARRAVVRREVWGR